MDYAAGGTSGQLTSGHTPDGFRTPVGAHVGEDLRGVGEQMAEQHGHTVERIVFRGHDIGLTYAVPVERSVEQSFGEVAVGIEVGPLTLALESGQQSVVAESFFLESGFEQTWVALHQVAHDHGHLHHKLPVAVLGGAGFLLFRDVDVLAFVHLAVLFGPCHGAGEFLFIVYAFGHTAHDLGHVHRLIAHAQIFLEEVGIDHGSGYAHGHAAERQIGLAPHLSHGESRTGETEQLLCHIGRNSVVGEVLYVVSVDAESRQAFLGMCGKNGGKIDGSGPLSAVESPHGLGPIGVHVHSFTAIAPARGHSDGGADAFALEFFGTCGGFRHTAYGSVGDHALHGRSVGIAEIG